MAKLTHVDERGAARMVDVTEKSATAREAVASGSVIMQKSTLRLIEENRIAKGDVLATARIAAVMAAKKTSELIPLCHPLNISGAEVDFRLDRKKGSVEIVCRVKTTGQTGVEMEALTAVSAAALTIYDMCKAADRGMTISEIVLREKKGGRSGHFKRQA